MAATQTPGEAGKKWFQGTADAVRQFIWVFEVNYFILYGVRSIIENHSCVLTKQLKFVRLLVHVKL